MKKLLSIMLASTMALTAFGGLAACGGDDNRGPGIQKVDLPTVADANDPTASMENEDLTPVPATDLIVWAPAKSHSIYQQRVNVWTSSSYKNGKYANVNVSFVDVGEGNVATQLGATPEDGGDIFFFASDQYATLKSANVLQPLAGTIGKYYSAGVQARDDEGAWKPVTDATGITWAFPFAVNTFFLWYDSTFFTEAEVQSLDTMHAKAEAQGKNIIWPIGTAWYSMVFFHGMGCTTDYIDGDYVTDIDGDKGWIAAQSMYAYLNPTYNNGVFIDAANDLDADVPAGFKDGSVVAAFEGDWITSDMPAKAKTAILPKFKELGEANGTEHRLAAFNGSKYCGVNALRPNAQISMALASFLTNEESQTARFNDVQTVPTNKNSAAAANSEVVNTALAQAEYSYMQDRQVGLWDVGHEFVKAIANGTTTSDTLRASLNSLAAGLRNP